MQIRHIVQIRHIFIGNQAITAYMQASLYAAIGIRISSTVMGDFVYIEPKSCPLIFSVPPYEQISCGFPPDLAITIGQGAQFQCAEVVQSGR